MRFIIGTDRDRDIIGRKRTERATVGNATNRHAPGSRAQQRFR